MGVTSLGQSWLDIKPLTDCSNNEIYHLLFAASFWFIFCRAALRRPPQKAFRHNTFSSETTDLTHSRDGSTIDFGLTMDLNSKTRCSHIKHCLVGSVIVEWGWGKSGKGRGYASRALKTCDLIGSFTSTCAHSSLVNTLSRSFRICFSSFNRLFIL